MYRFSFAIVAIAVQLLMASVCSAQEPQRFALLIGNQGYHASVGALKNPHNDIALVGAALTKQGYTVLPPVKEAKRSAILVAVRGLVARLNSAGPGAVGFIYYSGHGAAEKDTGINYLIPVDAQEPGSAVFWEESVKLDEVLKLLEGARNAAKFIVFDACRNELQLPERTSDKGLIPVREHQGMFIAYSTAPGRVASDRGATSGPYAAALAAEFAKPGLDHLGLFQNVKETVFSATGGMQQPWESNGLVRRVMLTSPAKAPVVVPQAAPPMSEAAIAWDGVKDSRSPAVLEAFASQFAGTVYAALSSERLTDLRREAAAAKALDDQKQAAVLRKQTEDRRRAEEEAARKKAVEAAEVARLSAVRQAEAQRMEEVEAARRRAEVEAQEKLREVEEARALASAVQVQLKRIGCDPGRTDGNWQPPSRTALRKYATIKKIKLASEQPAVELVDQLKNEPADFCKASPVAPLPKEPKQGQPAAKAPPVVKPVVKVTQAPVKPGKNCGSAIGHSFKVWRSGGMSGSFSSNVAGCGMLTCSSVAGSRICSWQ